MNNQLTEYFTRSEFACPCKCGFNNPDAELLALLTALREHFDAPVNIHSGCRCFTYNKTIDGAALRSYHTRGQAVDVHVTGWVLEDVYDWLCANYPATYGFKLYSAHVHIDIRNEPWRGV
jgi:uncharacterized protein YcbK (DUF882 family)